MPLPISDNEQQRLQELYRFNILDTEEEKEFDDIVHTAAEICHSSIAFIAFPDTNRIWVKASVGLPVNEFEKKYSLSYYNLQTGSFFEIYNAADDERFNKHSCVQSEINVCHYAGFPLITEKGIGIGVLAVANTTESSLTGEQKQMLHLLAEKTCLILELRLRKLQLQHSNQLQSRLVSILAHDVRNPLASIKSVIELRQTHIINDEEADEMFQIASTHVEATIEMVENVIDWASLQAKGRHIAKSTINAREASEKSIQYFTAFAKEKNTIFINKVSAIVINHDATAISFILRTLLSNSVKYTEEGIITLSSYYNSKYFTLVITDTGTGMDEWVYNHLFTSSKNYSMPGTRNEPGNGLGLLLLRDYLEMVKGMIEIKTAPGKGTTVAVSIPVHVIS